MNYLYLCERLLGESGLVPLKGFEEQAADLVNSLDEHSRQILELVSQGKTFRQVAAELGMSYGRLLNHKNKLARLFAVKVGRFTSPAA